MKTPGLFPGVFILVILFFLIKTIVLKRNRTKEDYMSKDYRTEEIKVREQRQKNEVNKIAARIREARKDSGLTQTELADFSRLSVSTIKRYEHGKGEMSIQNIFLIASALNLNLEELISDRKFILYRFDLLKKPDQDLVTEMINKCYIASKVQN